MLVCMSYILSVSFTDLLENRIMRYAESIRKGTVVLFLYRTVVSGLDEVDIGLRH
jgi:hypothetical protein